MSRLFRRCRQDVANIRAQINHNTTLWTANRLSSTLQKPLDQEPLRILFCGSDDFSIRSLEALHQYSQSGGSHVFSIDVATKTDKRTGRGLRTISAPPIKHAAQRLGLPVHQFDTFRGWSLPSDDSGESYVNMIIAVSFGLLVPPRILNACRFGGLNVHPSLLPDLKGSAPVEYAIINGYSRTGVTVQTLHPSKFDEGQIVFQTPQPGIPIPNPDQITAPELKNMLAPVGAEMLVRTIRDYLYLQPLRSSYGLEPMNFAPKLSSESRHITFVRMEAPRILRLNRALGRLWVNVKGSGNGARDLRLTFGSGMRLAHSQDLEGLSNDFVSGLQTGLPFALVRIDEDITNSAAPLLVKTADGSVLCAPEMTISGMKAGKSTSQAARAGLLSEASVCGDTKVYQFKVSPS